MFSGCSVSKARLAFDEQRHPVLFVLLSRLLPGHQLCPWQGESTLGNTWRPWGEIQVCLRWSQMGLAPALYPIYVSCEWVGVSPKERGLNQDLFFSLPVCLEYKPRNGFLKDKITLVSNFKYKWVIFIVSWLYSLSELNDFSFSLQLLWPVSTLLLKMVFQNHSSKIRSLK